MLRRHFFAIAACVFGTAFAFVTPPFKVPDEIVHFWRGEAIAGGHFIPNGGGRPDSANVPRGLKTFAWAMLVNRGFRAAFAVPLEATKQSAVEFPAWYTPLPYVPQALAAAVCRLLSVRPMITFYAGRLATLAASLALIFVAMRAAPAFGPVIAGVTLLPMTLFIFASWSADAITVALSILFTAMLFGNKEPPLLAIVVVALALALCKPANFLIAAMIFVTSKSWMRISAVIGATIAGTVASFAYARMAYYHQRSGLPIDAGAQLRCIAADPARFVRVEFNDLISNGRWYLEEMIGRLGLMDVKLPSWLIWAELALLISVGIASSSRLNAAGRGLAAGVVTFTVAGVLLSQYLTWSIACGDVIEGVQGRYFLPILPLALTVISIPERRWQVRITPVVIAAVILDGFALAVLWQNYR